MSKIIQNAVRIRETGEILKSYHVHHYVTATTPSGKEVMVDGGTDYFRSSVDDPTEVEDLRLTEASSLEEIKSKLLWGTYGKDGKGPFQWKRLIDCETDHLEAILRKVAGLPPLYNLAISMILNERS